MTPQVVGVEIGEADGGDAGQMCSGKRGNDAAVETSGKADIQSEDPTGYRVPAPEAARQITGSQPAAEFQAASRKRFLVVSARVQEDFLTDCFST